MKRISVTFTTGGSSCNHNSTDTDVFENDELVASYSASVDQRSLSQVLDYLDFIRDLSQDEWFDYRANMKNLF